MKEVGVVAGVSNNNISVVDRAEVPRKKFKPRLLLNMAIALALGIFSGVLLALLFESLDDTVKSGSDLERLLDKPVLGIIPRVGARYERTRAHVIHNCPTHSVIYTSAGSTRSNNFCTRGK